MKTKIILGTTVIAGLLIFLSMNFLESKVEYGTFSSAISSSKKIQVKGTVVLDKETIYDAQKNQFVFFLKDDSGTEMKVMYAGAKPNNFELAEAVVVKGRCIDGVFQASDILTKCPSKYEGNSEQVKKTL